MFDQLADNLPSLEFGSINDSPKVKPMYDEIAVNYFRHYGLDIPGVEHLFGSASIGKHIVAVHIFTPPKPAGTVLAVHGYYNHVGVLKHLINRLIDESFAVLTFDFPGHGLSSGETGHIEDFTENLEVFSRMMDIARVWLPNPVHVVAHSMGAGIATEYLLSTGIKDDQRFVLVSPNIRSNMWTLTRTAHALVSPFTSTVRRFFGPSSQDKEFLEFRKTHDPLQPCQIPVRWFEELIEWNAKMIEFGPDETSFLIIQGDSDDTVDFKYNISYYRVRFPNLELAWIRGGEHHLINELPAVREEVFGYISGYLSGAGRTE